MVCIAGASGVGNTELALEFVYSHEYKILLVHGASSGSLRDHLGIAVSDNTLQSNWRDARSPRRRPG